MLRDLLRTLIAIAMCWGLIAAIVWIALSPAAMQFAWTHPQVTTAISCSIAFASLFGVAILALRRRLLSQRSRNA
ncbi:MAG: hypothetical protein IV086_14310 [Hyphomonadaceae bacterium]|nr:MAG: hypothetical protein FD160_537 [Caulobacteraceae bacterium]MBT9446870.1 hypothetical protein [Hyphomonadaceae bacterium]TPW06195.1 MAG: hypothetical protein FD124_1852 [Alphaproteobacteria bacterium]